MFANKIAEARIAKGWNQKELAERLGTTQQVVSRYENGERDPKASVIAAMSAELGVTISYLLGLEGAIETKEDESPSMFPVFGRIAAGTPREALEQSDAVHWVSPYLAESHPHAFWLTVSGNSMNRLFPDGSLVLIDPETETRNGDISVVFVNGDDATLKRVYFEENAIRLHPESYDPEYRDRVIDPSDPDAPEVRIIGKAVSYTAPEGWRA